MRLKRALAAILAAVLLGTGVALSTPTQARADWLVQCWRTIHDRIVCYRIWTPGFGGGGGGGW